MRSEGRVQEGRVIRCRVEEDARLEAVRSREYHQEQEMLMNLMQARQREEHALRVLREAAREAEKASRERERAERGLHEQYQGRLRQTQQQQRQQHQDQEWDRRRNEVAGRQHRADGESRWEVDQRERRVEKRRWKAGECEEYAGKGRLPD